ncbi:MAG TPA: type II secretion system protein [Firmicutes bacterium]|nr:type II secretion system protein [Bacillota bacterium]
MNFKCNLRINQQGFLLIELLVAVTVLGLVAAPILAAFITGYSSLAGAGEKTCAINLARRQMEQVKSMGYQGAYLYYIEQGNSLQTNRDGLFTLETSVAPECLSIESQGDESALELELLKIMVTVFWGEPERERSLQAVSYLSSR